MKSNHLKYEITLSLRRFNSLKDDWEPWLQKTQPHGVSSGQLATRWLASPFGFCGPENWLSRKPDESGPDVPLLALQACILLNTAVSLTTPVKQRCHIPLFSSSMLSNVTTNVRCTRRAFPLMQSQREFQRYSCLFHHKTYHTNVNESTSFKNKGLFLIPWLHTTWQTRAFIITLLSWHSPQRWKKKLHENVSIVNIRHWKKKTKQNIFGVNQKSYESRHVSSSCSSFVRVNKSIR